MLLFIFIAICAILVVWFFLIDMEDSDAYFRFCFGWAVKIALGLAVLSVLIVVAIEWSMPAIIAGVIGCIAVHAYFQMKES